jgi:alpha-glucosidase (family GH31 glycosyl hydrolase)
MTSGSKILKHNSEFNKANIPVDVLWMDIPHSDGNRYFTFDPE